MNRLKECIDLQIENNKSKNLFHKEYCKIFGFTENITNAVKNIEQISSDSLNELINYTTENVLQEFCRVNQYLSFYERDKIELKEIYYNLYKNIIKKENNFDSISKTHYENLKVWLIKTNPFCKEMYAEKETILKAVACFEYSSKLQKEILHLNDIELLEPILDIGCGKEGSFVKYLRKEGFETYGIDRFSDNSFYTQKADWLEYNYGTKKWGTIISNLGFSNHFIHNHLLKDGNFIEYAKKYMEILKSLKVEGCFCYAPDLPFIEKYLDENTFSVKKYGIDNLSFKTTIIQKLI